MGEEPFWNKIFPVFRKTPQNLSPEGQQHIPSSFLPPTLHLYVHCGKRPSFSRLQKRVKPFSAHFSFLPSVCGKGKHWFSSFLREEKYFFLLFLHAIVVVLWLLLLSLVLLCFLFRVNLRFWHFLSCLLHHVFSLCPSPAQISRSGSPEETRKRYCWE